MGRARGLDIMAETKYVVFKLADELYGVPIERVERILPEQAVTRLPKTPKMFLGIFDLRGETVPAIDLRSRFELVERNDTANFVVLQTSSGRCAFRVDGVDGIVTLDDREVEESPELFDTKDDFVLGIGKDHERLIVLIEADEIIPRTLRAKVASTARGEPQLAAA